MLGRIFCNLYLFSLNPVYSFRSIERQPQYFWVETNLLNLILGISMHVYVFVFVCVFLCWLVGWFVGFYGISTFCRLFNAKFIFM